MRDKLLELYQENLEGRGIASVAVVASVGVGLLYFFGYVSETAAGATVAGAMVLITASIMLRHAFEVGGAVRAVVLALTAATAAATAVPVIATIAPGDPLAGG